MMCRSSDMETQKAANEAGTMHAIIIGSESTHTVAGFNGAYPFLTEPCHTTVYARVLLGSCSKGLLDIISSNIIKKRSVTAHPC